MYDGVWRARHMSYIWSMESTRCVTYAQPYTYLWVVIPELHIEAVYGYAQYVTQWID